VSILIENVKGVGSKTKTIFNNVGIKYAEDLLLTFPYTYENYEIGELSLLNHLEVITIKGKIIEEPKVKIFPSIKAITFTVLVNNENISVIGFRQDYLINTLKLNDFVMIKGKYNYYKRELVANRISDASKHQDLKPIYKIDNVLDTNISKVIKEILINENIKVEENLSKKIIDKYRFLNRVELVRKAHFPKDKNDLALVIRRLKYEEAYFFQKDLIKNINKPYKRKPKKYDLTSVKDLINKIPFELTNDQKQAVNDCFKSFKEEHSSYRLIQGDVGSGKTVVAAIAIYGAITAGDQVALMVPTEMLARQHYEYFSKLFPSNIKIDLLTSDIKNKKAIYNKLKLNETNLIIGTHALIEDSVVFSNLGLIVIDEQHKFGVRTRDSLVKKASKADLIYLTATPIPRTLAISLFGEAKISVIKEKPKERKAVVTKYVMDSNLNYIYKKVIETLNKNEKVYIVAPAIDSLHSKYNVNNLYLEYKRIFKDKNIYLLHSKLSKDKQNEAIDNFIKDDSAILIATTMIEVGIDIKDATLILIYAANYFGLSQLHQLRGRVGRSNLLSQCLLISEEDDVERLKILENVSDGFLLSKYDLKLRGPGALIGLEQSGFPKFKYLDFLNDYEILKRSRSDLYDIIKNK